MTALLIDLGAVPEAHCNDCLDDLFKSMAEPASDDRSIWAPHDNAFLRAHVEDVTRRFQRLLEQIQDALARLILGEPIGHLLKSDAPWMRWDQATFDATRERLEAKGPANFDLDDWLTCVDWIVNRYVPDDVIRSESEYLTIRSQFAGMIQANMERQRAEAMNRQGIDSLMLLVPTEFRAIPPKALSPIEAATLRINQVRAAQAISDLTDQARSRMKRIVIEHVQAKMLGQTEGQWTHMRQRLFDEFGQLNRDFRRIAVTEAGEACNTGFVAAQRPGSKVRRQEAYRGACAFCKSINGKVMTVVEPGKADKNGDTEVWIGKTNIGRSAAPRMRQGGEMVERPSAERWWVAAGVQHPHCRGSWVVAPEQDKLPDGVDPGFASWLDGELAKIAVKPPS